MNATLWVGLLLVVAGAMLSLTGVGLLLGIPLIFIGVGLLAMRTILRAVRKTS